MDDDSIMSKSKIKTEATSKVKDGYVQLAEKMEQVRSQVAKMERKYDELYQTVKEKEHERSASVSSDKLSAEETKVNKEAPAEGTSSAKHSIASESTAQEKPNEDSSKPRGMDIEKMENNPFL